MNESTAMLIFAWLGDHPVLAGIFIFTVALIESLAIVGIIVPGIFFMLIIGAYLATDQFSFLTAVILAFAGAVSGDSISYYLGYRYKNKLITIWPISRYPETFEKGVNFFNRHGNKSIILGRFIGPLRPIIPAIAGMFQMPRNKFLFSNILSAAVWAPVVLLPGYIIGLSIQFASDIAGPLVLLVLVVGGLLWILFWIIKSFYLHLLPRFDDAVFLLLTWSHKYPIPGKVPSILLETKYQNKDIFTVLLLLYIIFSSIFFTIPAFLGDYNYASNIDIFLKDIFLNFNNPVTNQLVVKILNLVNLNWLLFLSSYILLIITWKKYSILLRYYLFTLVLTGLLQIILSYFINIDKSNNLFATSIYLFLTFVLTINSSLHRKILIYGVCYTLISTVIFAQIYNENTNITPLVLTSLFSLLWITTLTSTYRHHPDKNKFSQNYQNKTGLIFLIFMIINVIYVPSSIPLKKSNTEKIIIEKTVWENFAWKKLSSHRKGFINKSKQNFNIQWSDSKEEIIRQINTLPSTHKSRWKLSNPPKVSEVLQFLNPQASITSLAVLPHLHNGEFEKLRFIRVIKDENGFDELLVIRLWQTNLKIKQFKPKQQIKPLWLGTLTKLVIVKRAGVKLLHSRLIDENNFNEFYLNIKNEGTVLYSKKNEHNVLLLSFLN